MRLVWVNGMVGLVKGVAIGVRSFGLGLVRRIHRTTLAGAGVFAKRDGMCRAFVWVVQESVKDAVWDLDAGEVGLGAACLRWGRLLGW